MKYVWLLSLLISPAQKKFLNGFISLLLQLAMIQIEINIYAATMRLDLVNEDKLRNPPSHQHHIVTVLPQEVAKFK
jgi:hypothetical protein